MSETKKTEPNPNQKNEKNQVKLGKNWAKPEKPSQTRKNRANRFEPVFILKNQTETKLVGLNWFWFFLFLKNSIWLLVFDENQIKQKMITHNKFHNGKRYWSLCNYDPIKSTPNLT